MFVLLGNIENLGGQHHNLKLKDIKIGMFLSLKIKKYKKSEGNYRKGER